MAIGEDLEKADLLPGTGPPNGNQLLLVRDVTAGKDYKLPGNRLPSNAPTNPNDTPGAPKFVRFLTRAELDADPNGGDCAEDLLDNTLCLNLPITVDFGGAYTVVYDPRGDRTVFRTGHLVANDTVPARLVRADSPAAFATPYASVDGATYQWRLNEHASAYVAGQSTAQYFRSRFPGVHPAPTAGGDPTHWEAESETDVPTGAGSGYPPRDPYDVPAAKAQAVIAAYAQAGGPYPETDPAFFGCCFIDDNSSPGDEFDYRCTPGRPATTGPAVWKWRRYLETGS